MKASPLKSKAVDPLDVINGVYTLARASYKQGISLALNRGGRSVWPTDKAATAFSLVGAFMRIAHELTGDEIGCPEAMNRFRQANSIDNISKWEVDQPRDVVLKALEMAMHWTGRKGGVA